MRSALWQAVDIVGMDAEADATIFLACVIEDLMRARWRAGIEASPAWRAALAGSGPDRVRFLMKDAVFFLVDWTEPEPLLRRLGLIPPALARLPLND